MSLITNSSTSNSSNSFNNDPTNASMIGNPNTEIINTTRFTTEGLINKVENTLSKVPEHQLRIVNDPRFHQIKNFLERPYKIHGGVWKAGVITGEAIYDFKVEQALNDMIAVTKVQGFYAFKGTVRVRVLINAQPFHTGMLQLAYLPRYYEVDNSKAHPQPIAGFYLHNNSPFYNMRYESGCPSVTLNVGTSSSCELAVPYVSSESLMNISSACFGKFQLRAMVPIADATNAASVPYSIYVSFEDVEMYATAPYDYKAFVPTPIIPPSSTEAQMNADILQQIAALLSQHQQAASATPSQAEEAASNASGGVISGISDKVGGIASALTAIPGVADIAGPVSWAAKGVSSIAKIFGFSRPHNHEESRAVWINPFKDFAHCDSNDNSTKLTISNKQEVEVSPIGPISDDEMNITHITSRPCFFANFGWLPAMKPGSLIAALPINPRAFSDVVQLYPNSANVYSSHTYLSYIANMFMYWMGTIRLTFTVVGNKFYSGRLRFVYVPEVPLADRDKIAPDVYSKMQHTYTHIVDIRDANTFTVDCSYLSRFPWTPVNGETHSNVLYVFVEQDLTCPSTVTQSLILTTHVSGLEDLTFAGPTRPRGSPMNGHDNDISHFNYAPGASLMTETIAQGFTNGVNSADAPVNIPIVNDTGLASPAESHKAAIGDPITSLRTLVKRFTPHDTIKWSTNYLMLQPFKLTDVQDHPNTTRTKFVSSDLVDYVSCLYRYRKGGMRLAIRGFATDDVTVAHRNLDQLKLDNATSVYNSTANEVYVRPGIARQIAINENILLPETFSAPCYSMIPHSETIQGTLQLEVPYYHSRALIENLRGRYLYDNTTTAYGSGTLNDMMAVPQSIEDYTTSNVVSISRTNKDSRQLVIYRAAADDFNCGFLLGPPPTVDHAAIRTTSAPATKVKID